MYKSTLIAFASLLFFLTSCNSEESLYNENSSITFSLNLPGNIQSRNSESRFNITNVYYSIFLKSDPTEAVDYKSLDWDGISPINITLDLVPSQKYSIVFFAYNSNIVGENLAYNYDPSSTSFSVDYQKLIPTNVDYEVFTGCYEDFTSMNETIMVNLTRPFAQINIGTNDLNTNSVKAYLNSNPNNGFNSSLNIDGKSGLASEVKFINNEFTPYEDNLSLKTNNIVDSANKNNFPVEGFTTLSSHYVLISPKNSESNTLLNATYTIEFADGQEAQNYNLANLPVKANYQTNIYGSLITTNKDLKITCVPGFADDNDVEIPADTPAPVTADEFLQALQNGTELTIPAGTTTNVTVPYQTGIYKDIKLHIDGELILSPEKIANSNYDYYFNLQKTMSIDGKGKITANGSFAIFNITGGTLNISNVELNANPDIRTNGTAINFFSYGNVNLENLTINTTRSAIRIDNKIADSLTLNNVTINQQGSLPSDNSIGAIELNYSASEATKTFNASFSAVNINAEGTPLIVKGGCIVSLSDCQFETSNHWVGETAIIKSEYTSGSTTRNPQITINSGEYYTPSTTAKEGIYSITPNTYTKQIILRGGKYSTKPISITNSQQTIIEPSTNYLYQEITGDPKYHWEVIKQ